MLCSLMIVSTRAIYPEVTNPSPQETRIQPSPVAMRFQLARPQVSAEGEVDLMMRKADNDGSRYPNPAARGFGALAVWAETPHPKLEIVFAILMLGMTGFFAAKNIASWPIKLRYPGDLDVTEGRQLKDLIDLREGLPIYAPATPERYNSAEYGPLFYLLGSRLVDPSRPSFLLPRLLSMLATLGLAAGCALLAYWLAGSYLAAGLAALLLLAFAFTTNIGAVVHADTVALLLWFGGFLIAHRFRATPKILLAVPFMTLALFYKGQYVSSALAVLLFLLLEKRWRLAAGFAALLGLAGVSLFLTFQFVIFRHQAFLQHFLLYNVLPYNPTRGVEAVVVVTVTLIIPILAGLTYLRAYPDKLVVCYFGWALMLLLLTLGKPGSGLNYCLDLALVLCPLFAGLLTKNIRTPPSALFSLCLLGLALWLGQLPKVTTTPSPVDFASDQAVETFLRKNFPPHAVGLGIFTGDLVRAGLDTPIQNIYQYSWLICKGTLPPQSLITQVQDHRFRVILLNTDFLNEADAHQRDYLCLPESLHQAIMQNYRPAERFAFDLEAKRHYYAWVPRN